MIWFAMLVLGLMVWGTWGFRGAGRQGRLERGPARADEDVGQRGSASAPLVRERVLLWVAEGFGTGRFPRAPGTCGTLVGFLWTAALLATGHWVGYLAGSLVGVALSVWVCGRAEVCTGRKDPGWVVLDEIVAIPLCFAVPVGMAAWGGAGWPNPGSLFAWPQAAWTLGVFVLFRCFDIAKLWPVRQSQELPGGWGVTVDDLLAAVQTNGLWGWAWLVGGWPFGS